MEKALDKVKFNHAALKKQYDEHVTKCKQIAEEVEKWGKKAVPNLNFLKAVR